jgi:hypothetical protein
LSTAALVVIAGVVGMIIIGEHTSDNKTETAASYDVDHPETITRTIHEKRANAVARLDNGKLLLTYSIDPWALTTGTAKSIYYFKAKKFFQDAFRSPVVQYACVEGTGTFKDVRGRESQGKAIELCMSRTNASTVQWTNLDDSNLLLIADSSYVHPAFR